MEQKLIQRQEEVRALGTVAGTDECHEHRGPWRQYRRALDRSQETLEIRGGGRTSGALWGKALVAAGEQLAPGEANNGEDIAAAVTAALQAVRVLGKDAPGDNTMADAVQPFSDWLQGDLQAGASLKLARHNEAPHSLGHPDLAAMSLASCLVSATRPPLPANRTPRGIGLVLNLRQQVRGAPPIK